MCEYSGKSYEVFVNKMLQSCCSLTALARAVLLRRACSNIAMRVAVIRNQSIV